MPRAGAGGVRAPETWPRPYLLFHVPQQLFFDCVLCAAHGAAGGGQAAPSGPPEPPCALPASAPPDSAPHAPGGAPARRTPRLQPPQPLPGAQLRSHLPSPADVRRQARPLPTAGREGVCAPRLGRGGQGGCGRLGASGPGARRWDGCHGDRPAPAPRARTRIVSAGSQLLVGHCAAGGLGLEKVLASGLTSTAVSVPDSWPLGEEPGGSALGRCGSNLVLSLLRISWPAGSSSLQNLREKKQEPDRELRGTGAGALEEAFARLRVSDVVLFILQICGKKGTRVGIRDITEPVTQASPF